MGGASSGFSQAGVRGAGEVNGEVGQRLVCRWEFTSSALRILERATDLTFPPPCQVEGPGIREACQPLHKRKPTAQALGENALPSKSSDLNSPAAGALLPS